MPQEKPWDGADVKDGGPGGGPAGHPASRMRGRQGHRPGDWPGQGAGKAAGSAAPRPSAALPPARRTGPTQGQPYPPARPDAGIPGQGAACGACRFHRQEGAGPGGLPGKGPAGATAAHGRFPAIRQGRGAGHGSGAGAAAEARQGGCASGGLCPCRKSPVPDAADGDAADRGAPLPGGAGKAGDGGTAPAGPGAVSAPEQSPIQTAAPWHAFLSGQGEPMPLG